jgi:hypothetical protein
VSSEPRGAALKVGPHATRSVEPRQARKGATVRRPSRVPWEYLTGACFVRSSRYVTFGGGCTVTVAVLDGEVAVPCSPQSALAGLNPLPRAFRVE